MKSKSLFTQTPTVVGSSRAARPARPTQAAALSALALGLVLALTGCNGSGSTPGAEPAAQAARQHTLATAPTPLSPAQHGSWSAVHSWPLIPIHAVLMPDGRMLTFGAQPNGAASAFFSVDMWDNAGAPESGHLTVANGTGNDLFCGSQLLLPPLDAGSPPSVFVAGGDAWNGQQTTSIGHRRSTVYNGSSNTLAAGPEMAHARWYASSTTLVNGETYIQGGFGGAERPEVRQLDGSFRHLTSADTSFLQWSYPRNYVLPSGRLFGYDYEGRMYFVDPSGTGRVDALATLPLQYFGAGSSAMFRPGRILQVGGNTNAAAVIDVTGEYPVFTPTQSTSSNRKLMNSTLLPDGQVLVTGGSPGWNELPGYNTTAEIWNPRTGQWTVGAAGARPRLYHSTALLLPDATVITGGGGAPAPSEADPLGEPNVEIYYPPYLFDAQGARAARPSIAAAPQNLELAKTFAVDVAGTGSATSRVTLVKTGAVTHGWNHDQRFMDLSFTRTATATGERLAVNAPSNLGDATPGYYMLFVFDGAGVPSVAHMMRMNVAPTLDASQTPVLERPADRKQVVGATVSLALVASDPNGDALTYSATGLPLGLSMDASTGHVTGSPTSLGSHDVVVSVSDGANARNASFVWTVEPQSALALSLAPTPGASLVGTTAVFNAAATGAGVEYAWNFGDGSADTAWSSTAYVGYDYQRPGSYVVTLKVRDQQGMSLSRSFLQTVYLGGGAKKPGVSGTMAVDVPYTDRARVWVVNQDNDSITGIDTVTNTVLGEVAVGAGPRAIAVSATDLLWVTNKADATISIVNPNTRQVTRTINLPRGSQPHGVATSPLAPMAFVVLEGTGEVLRFDTNTYVQTGSLAVGPNVRHVSVAGRGEQAFVTRFITPPLPGESTATVTPGSQGGEVIEFNPVAMTQTRVITLAHSDKPDAENQGSGVPNYLGAVAISPDHSQAFVPSKQDNVRRGSLRNGAPLNFQNTVRAISSRIVLGDGGTGQDDLARRIDHDNAGLASAVAYDNRGAYMFVALETSREVAVLDAHSGAQITRINTGRAPQGLALSPDGYSLYVNNFMDRTVGVYDLGPLLTEGVASVPVKATLSTVAVEKLIPQVLVGKQIFYDARDERVARDGYMSCASCHNEGGHDGRVWDMSQVGEGLRNTISLRGHGGKAGRLHWSANFDEVQDFEAQIRSLAGGSGLLADADLNAGTRARPLGDPKAGVSPDLDALAAYVNSLAVAPASPWRQATGALTASAAAGEALFAERCAGCHGGEDFTNSRDLVLADVGTLDANSASRLGQPLGGLDVPSLRDAWATAPYLHNGSAGSIEAAIQAHARIRLTATELQLVADYTRQIGGEASTAPASTSSNLIVRALSTLADTVGAWFEVRVDGAVVGAGQLQSSTWVDLVFQVATLVKDAIVEVVFKNDASTEAEDRNMAVQSIVVNGQAQIESTADGVVIDSGAAQGAFDGVGLTEAASTGGWMPWNAAIRFKLPTLGGGDSITVRARSTLANGVGALMEVRLNGVLLGTRLVSSAELQDFNFIAPTVSSGDRVDVVFINDEANETEDRNLHVVSVEAAGQVLSASAPGVLIDQGSGAQAFDGQGVVSAAQTGGWIPWNGALRLVVP